MYDEHYKEVRNTAYAFWEMYGAVCGSIQCLDTTDAEVLLRRLKADFDKKAKELKRTNVEGET